MKSFSVLLAFTLAAMAATAQTDTNAEAAPAPDTNAPAAPMPDTNAPAAPTPRTNAPAIQPATNAITAPDTNVVAALTSALAGKAPMHPMSLEDCIQEALQHNLDVQIERIVPQISLYALNAAYSGYDPLLNLSGQHSYDKIGVDGIPPAVSDENSFKSDVGGSLPWGMTYDFSGNVANTYGPSYSGTNEISGGTIGVQLTQPLLKNFWLDTPRLNIRVAKNRLKYSEQSLRLQVITSVTAVETAYYELIYARESVKVQQEALNLAQTQLDQDRQRMQIGTLAQLDVQQDESQVAKSQADLISALSTLGTDQRTLKNLLTDQYSTWFNTNIQPTVELTAPLRLFDLQDSWSKGMTLRPDLLQSRLDVEKQGIQLKFARNQLFPELDLVGTYGYNGAGREFSDAFAQYDARNRPFYSYGAQLSVPLSSIGPRNQYRTAKVTLKQVLLQLKQLEQNVMVGIDNDIGVARSDYLGVEASRQARIYAESALDAEQKKYAVGKSTTFTVLQLQNTLTSDRAAEIRALADYNEALANLAKDEGTTLERHHINIEAK